MASSNNFGGAMRAVLRAMKRSMMSATARIEQAIRGQIGQPAACMMVSKCLSAVFGASGIMNHAFRALGATFSAGWLAPSPTESVDNFVGKPGFGTAKTPPAGRCDTLMKNCAEKNSIKSTTWMYFRESWNFWLHLLSAAPVTLRLWSTAPSEPAGARAITRFCAHV